MFRSNFLSQQQASDLVTTHGTPLFVYSRAVLESQAQKMLAIPAPFGLTIRYAMKANPHPEVLQVLRRQGIKIDASSGYEAALAIEQGFAPDEILLTSQQLAHNLLELVEQGVQFNATSLRQLEEFEKLFSGHAVSVRINPGIGAGHSSRVNVGGVASSFGIWHEYIPQVHEIAKRHGLKINRLHTHIGSGTDPEAWQRTIHTSLQLAKLFPEAKILDLGGGFKVGRLDEENGADMGQIGQRMADELQAFKTETGRELKLELEPGSFLVVNAGLLLSRIEDVVDTGVDGYNFIKLDTGMNDILRPGMYGAQHPMAVLNNVEERVEYIVVGHNCESGDILTPAPGNPEDVAPRMLTKATIGDLFVIGGVGAYCAAMAAHGYNGFPDAKEILV